MTNKIKNLQINPDSRLGWMGQNQEPVHFREGNAERKNGHTCKITILDYPALQQQARPLKIKKKIPKQKNHIGIMRQIPNTDVCHGALSQRF